MTHIPKRRWFRFSLRTLFVLVTVAIFLTIEGIAFNRWSSFKITLVSPDGRFKIQTNDPATQ